MEYLRQKFVCPNQIKKGRAGVKDAIQYIKNGYSVALMIDQRVSEGEKILFFGKEALTSTLPAQLSKKFGLNIVPVYIERIKTNKFFLEFCDPVSFDKSKDKKEINRMQNIFGNAMRVHEVRMNTFANSYEAFCK